jgi:hypothetical protein
MSIARILHITCVACVAFAAGTVAANATAGSGDVTAATATKAAIGIVVALNPQPLPPRCLPPGCKKPKGGVARRAR